MRVVLYFGAVLTTTVIATLATAPFAVFHFNRLALLGVLANMVAVPLAALWVMPSALISFVLMPLGLEAGPLFLMGWGIEWILKIATAVQAMPGAIALIPAVPGWTLGLIALGGLWLCLWRTRWRLMGIVPVVVGTFGWSLATPPDVFVSADGRIAGIRTGAGDLLLPFGGRGFVVETWRRRSGLDPEKAGPKPADVTALRCDSLGCIYRQGDMKVAFARERAALSEDCSRADILISRTPVSRWHCKGPEIVIDRFDLWRNGAHVLYLGTERIETISVGDEGGGRPWQLYPRSHRPKIRN